MKKESAYVLRDGLLVPTKLGYNAIEDKGRRQAPQTRVKHEQDVLTDGKRKKLIATSQDQARNLALVSWMVRKHLDYVSKFHFFFKTGNEKLDTLVNRMFRWHGRPENLDYMGRFGRDEFFRMFELEKVLCGDAGIIKLPGMKFYAVESDEICKGVGAPEDVLDCGIQADTMGVPLGYAINRRTSSGAYEFDHIEPKQNVIFDAYWTRFKSQYRGVSPLSTAINTFQDLHEGFEFNLIKAKMHAIFGVAIIRKQEAEDGGFGGAGGATSETSAAPATAAQTELDINPRSVNILDMEPGADVKTIESGTPSSEYIQGSYLFIQIGMLALDIPVSCFDSRKSSFSARIADLNEYEVASDAKRTKNRYVRQAYSDEVLKQAWNDPADPWELRDVANRAGIRSLRDIQEGVEWIASGAPWLDKYKQVQGDQLGISLLLDNSIDAARRRGSDVFANIDKQAEVRAYAKLKGVPMVESSVAQVTTEADKSKDDIIEEDLNNE